MKEKNRLNVLKEMDSLYGYETTILDGEKVKVFDKQELIEFESSVTERLMFYVEEFKNKLDCHYSETLSGILRKLISVL